MPPVPFVPVAGPRQLPLLGNLPAFSRDPLAFLERLRDEFGDVVTWSLGPMKVMSLTHPEHIAELLGSNEGHFENLDAGWAFKQLVGKGIMRSQGAGWRRKRSLVQPSVRPSQVRRYATTMVDCAVALADRWHEGTQIDVLREMDQLSQRIVVRNLFGNDIGDQAHALRDAMSVAGREIGAELRGIGLFLPPWVRTPPADACSRPSRPSRLRSTDSSMPDRHQERQATAARTCWAGCSQPGTRRDGRSPPLRCETKR